MSGTLLHKSSVLIQTLTASLQQGNGTSLSLLRNQRPLLSLVRDQRRSLKCFIPVAVSSSYPKRMSATQKKPKLIAFDLDYTLWPFWVDTHVDPPFTKDKKGVVYDSRNRKVKCYPEVPAILKKLHKEGYQIGVASRTSEIDGANQLLDLFNWNQYITYKEIYPGSKDNHFSQIKKNSGLQYSEMLFFDDEHRNKTDLDKIGVLMIMVPDGVDKSLIKKGLEEYSKS